MQATVKKFVGRNRFASLASDRENGKTVYEVDVEAKNASYSVHMNRTGAVLGISLDIPMEVVPANVMAAAKRAHPYGKITEPEIRTVGGQMYYKLELMVGKAQHEMLRQTGATRSAPILLAYCARFWRMSAAAVFHPYDSEGRARN